MSNIDLSSLDTKKKQDTNKYSDIEEVFGLDLFVKKARIFEKQTSSNLFDGTKQKKEDHTNKLFTKVQSIEDTNIKQDNITQVNYGYIILGVICLCLIIIMFKGVFKNEHTH